jgi:hypothetical protein
VIDAEFVPRITRRGFRTCIDVASGDRIGGMGDGIGITGVLVGGAEVALGRLGRSVAAGVAVTSTAVGVLGGLVAVSAGSTVCSEGLVRIGVAVRSIALTVTGVGVSVDVSSSVGIAVLIGSGRTVAAPGATLVPAFGTIVAAGVWVGV